MFLAASIYLFVDVFVCLFVNTITSERLNIRWWNLVARCILQKWHPNSNLGIIGPNHRSPHLKMLQIAESLRKSKQTDVGMAHCVRQ